MKMNKVERLKTLTVTINGIDIEVTKKPIKNLRLGVFPPNGQVRVSAPIHLSNSEIINFATSKIDWILKHRVRYIGLNKKLQLRYIAGEEHFLFGTGYLLNVIYTKKSPRVEIKDERFLDLYVKAESTEDDRKKVLEDWYRNCLKEVIPILINKWQTIMNVKANSWGVKSMKTRWGTCNVRDKRIWLSLALAKMPQYCLEYVVIHELAHLIERSHGDRFKAIMDKFYPNWREIKLSMKQN